MNAKYDGVRFWNEVPHPKIPVPRVLGWLLTRKRAPWPRWIASVPGPKPPERVGPGRMRVTFVNHATVLVQMDGVNILTDPVWSKRVSPVPHIAGPGRRRDPGIRFEDLPPIDAVVISHSHYDHLDTPTLRRLIARGDRPRIFTGLKTGPVYARHGIPGAEEMDWWDTAAVGDVTITSVPAQHFSGRWLHDRDHTLWMGFVLSGPSGTVYFAGDTGSGPHFQQVRTRFGPPDVALLPIGAYLPRWFMASVHMDPGDAVRAHLELGAKRSIGMHFGTFALADESREAPLTQLAAARAVNGVSEEAFGVLAEGEGLDIR